jgi:hypothetical protein
VYRGFLGTARSKPCIKVRCQPLFSLLHHKHFQKVILLTLTLTDTNHQESIMETVQNVVNAASKAIWGDQNAAEQTTAHNETGGQEPISGIKGAGNANEPFDKGNEGECAPNHCIWP